MRAAPGEVTLLALASLTNVVLAVRLDPAVATNLGSLVVLGGAFNCMGNVNPAAEANIWHVMCCVTGIASSEALRCFTGTTLRRRTKRSACFPTALCA